MFGNLSWDCRKKLLQNRLKLFWGTQIKIKHYLADQEKCIKVSKPGFKWYYSWALLMLFIFWKSPINKDNVRLTLGMLGQIRIRGQCSSLGSYRDCVMCVMARNVQSNVSYSAIRKMLGVGNVTGLIQGKSLHENILSVKILIQVQIFSSSFPLRLKYNLTWISRITRFTH